MGAKRQRWLLRLAVDIDGGLVTTNQAYEELAKAVATLEAAGYEVLEHRGMCAPMMDYVKEKAEGLNASL